MRLRFNKKTSAKEFKKQTLARVRAAQRVAGRALSESFLEEVVKRVPRGEKWLDLYREALRSLESPDGQRWAVAGISPTKLTTVPASSTQIKFMEGGGKVIDVVRPYVWTVDTLPAIAGGYRGDAIVRPASESEMAAHRKTIRPELPRITEQLKNAGAQVIDDFPVVNGTVLMDLKFLQLRLEHGLGGFPRSPHWAPAARQAANKAKKWVAGASTDIRAALESGVTPEPEHTMSGSLEKLLKRFRKTTWT